MAAFAALWLRYLLTPLLGTDNPYHTAWLAVVFAAWSCGIGPAIVATVILTLGVDYWFLPPFGSFAIQDRTQSYGILGFVACSIAIIALGESNRRGIGVRARLAAIVESSDDAIISKNLDGIITSWNKGAEQSIGYTEAEAVGKHITMIIPPEHRDEEVMILERLRRGERIEHFKRSNAEGWHDAGRIVDDLAGEGCSGAGDWRVEGSARHYRTKASRGSDQGEGTLGALAEAAG